jgi:hypothetical protein
MYFIGALATAAYAAVYFPLLNTANPTVIFIAIVLSMVPHSMVYGPQAALIAECFTPRLRYSGASLGYQLASIVAGGPAPLIATPYWRRSGRAMRSASILSFAGLSASSS